MRKKKKDQNISTHTLTYKKVKKGHESKVSVCLIKFFSHPENVTIVNLPQTANAFPQSKPHNGKQDAKCDGLEKKTGTKKKWVDFVLILNAHSM